MRILAIILNVALLVIVILCVIEHGLSFFTSTDKLKLYTSLSVFVPTMNIIVLRGTFKRSIIEEQIESDAV
jgi:hypothetical protein